LFQQHIPIATTIDFDARFNKKNHYYENPSLEMLRAGVEEKIRSAIQQM